MRLCIQGKRITWRKSKTELDRLVLIRILPLVPVVVNAQRQAERITDSERSSYPRMGERDRITEEDGARVCRIAGRVDDLGAGERYMLAGNERRPPPAYRTYA